MQFNVFAWEKSKRIEIDINQLAARICAFNIRDSFHVETAKCFAIMARTELARKMKIYGDNGCSKYKNCEICTEPGHCLEYGIPNIDIPYERISKRTKEAVEMTKNKIITFEGKPIKPYFHYRCGGSTENSENVIGNKITYIRKVFCKYCGEAEDFDKDKFFTLEELEKLLNVKIEKSKNEYYNINGIFEKIEVDEEGRIRSLRIGGKSFKGTEIADKLKLNSTRFNYMPVRFLISCIGKGHGLGLCLIGSEKMASQGMGYEDILNYYYTGIKLEEMQLPEADKPLKGKRIVLDAASGIGDKYEGKSRSGLKEGKVNLLITQELGNILAEKGAEVYYTREDENHVILSKRVELANSHKPDLFISIKQNTFQNETASGTEIYYYKEDKEGKKLGEIMMEEITKELNSNKRGVREGEIFILRESRCSAVLIELLYLTSPKDERKLADAEVYKKSGEAISRAISRFYDKPEV